MTATKKPVNYLNNKDILKEIHKSKTSYCSFSRKEYHQYDLIIDTPDDPLEKSVARAAKPAQIKAAREARAARLSKELDEKIDPKKISKQDLIFRVMTWDHIPLTEKKPRKVVKKKSAQEILSFDDDENNINDAKESNSKKPKKDAENLVYEKVNFPPFQHYKLDENNNMICVGKSHWKGGVKTGEFCTTHGNITDKLARMYMKLCEKYAMKYNWRGYTYNDEMQASAILQLTHVGLRFNEAKSANPFAYYTAAITNSFCRVLNTEKRSQNIRDDILEMNGLDPSFTRQMSEMSFEDPKK